MATAEAQAAALKAFHAEEALWSLVEAKDQHNRRILEVKRGDAVHSRFYKHQEAFYHLNEAALTAAIMAAVSVIVRAAPPRTNAINRRYR